MTSSFVKKGLFLNDEQLTTSALPPFHDVITLEIVQHHQCTIDRETLLCTKSQENTGAGACCKSGCNAFAKS